MPRRSSWLFPDPPREFAWRRPLKIGLRAVHVLCAAILLGAHVFEVQETSTDPWLHATLLSGLLILLLDLHESAAFLLQVRGMVVILKLLLIGALPWLGSYGAWVIAGIVLISVISSHAPARVRYFLLVGRSGITGSRSKG
ncbi:MAG: hypothetical protein V3S30_05270 [Thermoanaerobaculia bacterium]